MKNQLTHWKIWNFLKLYNTYNKVKDVFAEPVRHYYFGLWRKDPMLPVWRRGPQIVLYKGQSDITHVVSSTRIKLRTENQQWGDKVIPVDVYGFGATHKLPKGVKEGSIVWNSKIRRNLRKYHLSWIPPVIQFPIWLSFYIFNRDVTTKRKYDDIRYEFPPQFTIVFFGLSFSCWLEAPKSKVNDFCSDDVYWETIIEYLEDNQRNLTETIVNNSYHKRYYKNNVDYFWAVRPEYLQPALHPLYKNIIDIEKSKITENIEIL